MSTTEPEPTTLVADPGVLRRWRTGPRWYHVVVAMIEDARVEQRRRDLVTAMSGVVEPSTPGQAHVTVWAAGFDCVPSVPDVRHLALTVGGAATFASALYLTVDAPGLPRLRADLAARNPAEDRTGDFVPHVTVGLYRQRLPIAAVQQRIAEIGEVPALRVTARVEHLVVDSRTDRLSPAPA